MLYLPKRDLDQVQIFFWISSNFPPNFQCLWSYNVLSATHQHCKHLKDKGKNLAAPRSFFFHSEGSFHTHLCDSAFEHLKTLHQAALLFFHEKDIMGDGNQHIFSIFPIGSMFCGNQPVRMCTEHEIPCSLEMCIICYLNKQVKKSETTLLVTGKAAFLSSSSLAH